MPKRIYKKPNKNNIRANTRFRRRKKLALYTPLIHNFKRKCKMATPVEITYASGGYNGFSYKFTLADLPNYTDFSNLFDSYMITKIKFSLVCNYTQVPIYDGTSGAGAGQGRGMLDLIMVVDHDDASVPSSDEAGYNIIREYSKSKTYYFNRSRIATIWFTPTVLLETYKSALTTGYTAKAYQYIDCDHPTLPHWGIRGVARQIGLLNGESVKLEAYCTYYLRMKDVL